MFDNGYECSLCGKRGKGRRSLAMHLSRSHKGWNTEKYVLHFYHEGINPKCACGCQAQVEWNSVKGRFNVYINGHNNRFTTDNQPKFTPQVIEKRNASIRNTYNDPKKSTEIKRKISESVTKALSVQDVRDKLSSNSRKMWDTPGFKEKMSETQKGSWHKNYSERYKKVFTKEFSEKISNANRNRDLKNSSKREALFFQALQGTFTGAASGKWLKFEGLNKCFDAWLPREEVLIEFDGVFWHGLDRGENFSLIQVRNMANDMFKNRLARSLGYSLIRIPMDDNTLSDLQNASELSDLVTLSRYTQLQGELIKDEMFMFRNDSHTLLTRDSILKARLEGLGGMGDKQFNNIHVPDITNFLWEYFLLHGFFLPECSDSIDKVLKKVRGACDDITNEFTTTRRLGNKWIMSRFKSYWSAGQGPSIKCLDRDIVRQVVKYRVGINNSKTYTYDIGEGKVVEANETFNITPSTIRRGFTARRATVSWFPPATAYQIWKWVVGDNSVPSVWDPSAGFGARALGFAAAYPEGTYTGCEPAQMTYHDLLELRHALYESSEFKGVVNFVNCGSEHHKPKDHSLDAVFTSPPYFDKEKYFDEPGQCWRDYPDIQVWKEEYFKKTLQNAWLALKPSGRLCLNVSSELADITRDTALQCGFHLTDTKYITHRRDHISRSRGNEAKREPLLLFTKL